MPLRHTPSDPGPFLSAHRLFWLSLIVYGAMATAAILAGREAFGDAANFLVKIGTNGQVTHFYDDFLREFHYSRVAAFHLTQGPAVAMLWLGMSSLTLVSIVYGTTLWGLKLASLALSYRLLAPADKPLFVFPLLTLALGSINADLYIVSESHVMVSLFWPVLIALTGSQVLSGKRCLFVVATALLMLVTFETALFLGPILGFVAIRAGARCQGRPRALCLAAAGIFLLGTAFALVAVVNPRDLTNRGAFISAVWGLLITGRQDLRHIPVGPVLSFVAIAIVGVVTVAQMRSVDPGRNVVAAVIALAAGAGVAVVSQVLLADATLQVATTAIRSRILNLVAPVAFALAYLVALEMRTRRLAPGEGSPLGSGQYRLLAGLAAVALLAQATYQTILTARWMEATETISSAIEKGPGGPIAFQEVIAGLEPRKAARITAIVGDWWIQPLSMLLARGGRVRSIVVFGPGNADVFRPFDPVAPASIPTMEKFGWNISEFIARLREARKFGPETVLDFRTGGNGWRFTKRGFSLAETWGTWTMASEAVLELPGSLPAGDLDFQVDLRPFLPRPESRLQVTVLAGGEAVATWTFAGAGQTRSVPLRIPARLVPADGPLGLAFRIEGAQSPASVGMSADSRLLGIGLVAMRPAEARQ